MNFRLFLLLILIEALAIIAGAFGLLLFFFMYFGSGASASSEKVIGIENSTCSILLLMPLVYGVIKFNTLQEKTEGNSYLYSGLFVTIVSAIYYGINYVS